MSQPCQMLGSSEGAPTIIRHHRNGAATRNTSHRGHDGHPPSLDLSHGFRACANCRTENEANRPMLAHEMEHLALPDGILVRIGQKGHDPGAVEAVFNACGKLGEERIAEIVD